MRASHLLALLIACLVTANSVTAAPSTKFELLDGDRVILLGNTFIERAQRYGHIEAAMTCRYPDRNIIFRNLGWSGDTVWAESRGIFDNAAKGYQRLMAQVKGIKPTVIILGYGGNEAFAGEAGLDRFVKQYNKLMDDLKNASGDKVRFVILSPLQHDNVGPPYPDPAAINVKLGVYRGALSKIAEDRKCSFVDLYDFPRWKKLTDNGMHLTGSGYHRVAHIIFRNHLEGGRDELKISGFTKLSLPGNVENSSRAKTHRTMRETIREKNEFYFHQWRPQNVTYLLLFRKREQGNNAVELPQFDPFILAKEKEIAALRSLSGKGGAK